MNLCIVCFVFLVLVVFILRFLEIFKGMLKRVQYDVNKGK